MIKIGVMGDRGSFSEQAGYMYVGREAMTEVEIVPLVTAEAVLFSLEKGLINKAIFPVMNNNGGIVIEAMHAMGKYKFQIEGMFDMDIHHMLMVLPDIKKENIHTVVSHDQALKQCRGYLDTNWSEVDCMPYKDTAAAAADLASGNLSPNTAVIASRRAAELYGLKILESSIQDSTHNKTTFLIATSLEN